MRREQLLQQIIRGVACDTDLPQHAAEDVGEERVRDGRLAFSHSRDAVERDAEMKFWRGHGDEILQRKAAEQHPCANAVGGDLRFQSLERFERALVAEPLHESQPDLHAVQVAIEVENVRLDGGRLAGCRCW